MGVPSASFVDTYSTKVTELMIHLVEYIQYLDNIKNPPIPADTGSGPIPGSIPGPIPGLTPNITPLDKNENGFPILPDPIPCDKWKKNDWDKLFTDFLGQQYRLATGGTTKHIPYKLILENQRTFIDSKYLPSKTTFRPPRNIGVDEIKSIFDYLLQRQRDHGAEETFRFKSIKWNGKPVPPLYQQIENSSSESHQRPGPSRLPISLSDNISGAVADSVQPDPGLCPSLLTQKEPGNNSTSGTLIRNNNTLPVQNNDTLPRPRPITRTSRRANIPDPTQPDSTTGAEADSVQPDPGLRPRLLTQKEPGNKPTAGTLIRNNNTLPVQQNNDALPRPRPITRTSRSANIPDSTQPDSTTGASIRNNNTLPRQRPVTRSANKDTVEAGGTHDTVIAEVNARARPRPRPITKGNRK
jgi:hypothetical protein